MHKAGQEIIAGGFHHVVQIDFYHTGEYPEWTWHHADEEFIQALDYELHMQEESTEQNIVHHYKGFPCKYTVQDGELGMGIYVFFKDDEGANTCYEEWGHHRRPRRYHSYGA